MFPLGKQSHAPTAQLIGTVLTDIPVTNMLPGNGAQQTGNMVQDGNLLLAHLTSGGASQQDLQQPKHVVVVAAAFHLRQQQ